MGKCGCFFFRATTLVSARKSHSSGVCGLVVRCLPFNPEGSGTNPCECAIFSRRFSSEKCPTLTVAGFFPSDYNLTLIGPLFLQSKLLKLLPSGQVQSAEISTKRSPLSFLVGAFLKKRARLLQSLFLKFFFFFFIQDRLEATNVKINVQLLNY